MICKYWNGVITVLVWEQDAMMCKYWNGVITVLVWEQDTMMCKYWNGVIIVLVWEQDNLCLSDFPIPANPACEEVGCGKWEPPMIQNPKYKGKWKPPLIDNPDYMVSRQKTPLYVSSFSILKPVCHKHVPYTGAVYSAVQWIWVWCTLQGSVCMYDAAHRSQRKSGHS